jgi:broad specificity phosphatase PhoE
MSKIPDLGDKKATELKDRFKNLPDILATYDNELKNAEQELSIKGKSLEHANRDNPSLYVFYDQRRLELKTLVEFMENQVERTRGRLFRNFTENFNRDLSDRAKNEYINGEQAYLDIYEIYLEVRDLQQQYESVVEAFKLRGYALKNITEIRVAQLENVVL